MGMGKGRGLQLSVVLNHDLLQNGLLCELFYQISSEVQLRRTHHNLEQKYLLPDKYAQGHIQTTKFEALLELSVPRNC